MQVRVFREGGFFGGVLGVAVACHAECATGVCGDGGARLGREGIRVAWGEFSAEELCCAREAGVCW